MSLAGLLNILDDDPQLRDVLARAGAGAGPVDTDLVAPPALRPVLAAALTQGGGQPTGRLEMPFRAGSEERHVDTQPALQQRL